MLFVLDASVVITWAMRDEDHSIADRAFEEIQGNPAVVPAIWWYEVMNSLLVNERRNRIAHEDLVQFLSDLSAFDIEVRPPEYSEQTLDLARRHNLSIYDASYLALAVERQIPIATLGDALQAAARSSQIPLLG
jgi:predicted nucleic acid-binding protein